MLFHMETHDILDTISKIRNHGMYLNHTFVIRMYCDFPTTLQSVRSMGSLDVPLGPAPSCRSSVVLGTKHLLIFARVRLVGPSVSSIVCKVWEFIIWSRALLVSGLCCSSKKSIASFTSRNLCSSEHQNYVQICSSCVMRLGLFWRTCSTQEYCSIILYFMFKCTYMFWKTSNTFFCTARTYFFDVPWDTNSSW
jgi:hypothetical protein